LNLIEYEHEVTWKSGVFTFFNFSSCSFLRFNSMLFTFKWNYIDYSRKHHAYFFFVFW
jgi:hypothetical protein